VKIEEKKYRGIRENEGEDEGGDDEGDRISRDGIRK
jgi:hypothetical protein